MSEEHRMNQNRITGIIRPKVTLISMTSNPVGTLFSVWYGSRHTRNVRPEVIQILYDQFNDHNGQDNVLKVAIKSDEIDKGELFREANMICQEYPEFSGDDHQDYCKVIRAICSRAIALDLPCDECVTFTFEIDNSTVAWREQLVRSHFSQYWIQTSRTMDSSTMDVNMPDSVELFGGEEGVKIYKDAVSTIREAYDKLIKMGVPSEDIRLQPQSHVERVYWMVNIRALMKTLKTRSGWIAQASLWTPIISEICKILRQKSFFDMISDDIGKLNVQVSYNADLGFWSVDYYDKIMECEDRYQGRDPLPVDPLYLAYTNKSMPSHTNIKMYDYMKSMFINIWADEYLEVLGWDRQNPSKLGGYDRPES